MPLSLCFRGGAVRFSFVFVAFGCFFSLVGSGLSPFGNKFLFIQKKKKFLQLKEKNYGDRIVKHRICNGMGTFLWHDFWNPVGPLLPYYGYRIVYDSAI